MQFDFDRFSIIASKVYREGNPYSLKECLKVFWWYFQFYEAYMGKPHPPIKAVQIGRIMQEMPWIYEEDRGGYLEDVESDNYYYMIEKHFATKYRRCDYNINHFFSGRIREMRFYEEVL